MAKPQAERLITPGDRTFERGRGCWNCTSFNNEDLSRQHWEACKQRDLAVIALRGGLPGRVSDGDLSGPALHKRIGELMQQGMTEGQAVEIVQAAARKPTDADMPEQMRVFEKAVLAGAAGLCVAGHAKSDFVHHAFLCDKWTARSGASVATEGKPLDKLPDELRDIADGRAKKA